MIPKISADSAKADTAPHSATFTLQKGSLKSLWQSQN